MKCQGLTTNDYRVMTCLNFGRIFAKEEMISIKKRYALIFTTTKQVVFSQPKQSVHVKNRRRHQNPE